MKQHVAVIIDDSRTVAALDDMAQAWIIKNEGNDFSIYKIGSMRMVVESRFKSIDGCLLYLDRLAGFKPWGRVYIESKE